MFSDSLAELQSRIVDSSLAVDNVEYQLALLKLQLQEKRSMLPSIAIGTLVRVKPDHQGSNGMTTSDKLQSVIDAIDNQYLLSSSSQLWTASDLIVVTQPKLPHELELFETCTLPSKSTLTLVPNGYVMTSTSGPQVLIPSNLI